MFGAMTLCKQQLLDCDCNSFYRQGQKSDAQVSELKSASGGIVYKLQLAVHKCKN